MLSKPRSAALIIKNDQILLIERKTGPKPVYYVLPGGGIETGETPEQAAIRELNEELGAEIEVYSKQLDSLQTDRQTWILRANLISVAEPKWLEGHKQKPDDSFKAVWIPIATALTLEIYPKGTINLLETQTNTVKKAGAIITSQQDNTKVLLLYRARHKDWSFPKGHIEQGEDSKSAMIREVKEETGLSVKLQAALPRLTYTHNDGTQVAMEMYHVRSLDDSELKLEHDGDDLTFVPLEEVESRLSYDNLKDYFRSIKEALPHADL